MEKIAFRMQLEAGQADEYRSRHDDIWPELVTLLHDVGISDYSIFLDDASNALFAVLTRSDDHTMDTLPEHEIMQRWWQHMSDIMATLPDGSPRLWPLQRVFQLD